MSKVKFIQWGTDAKPKQYEERWNVDEQGNITESGDFAKVKENYKGGIIFVTYLDAKDKITQEIWANGVQYSVGGGGGNIIYGDTPVDADGKAGDVTGDEGYIYIYKSDTTQTAYYWNDGQWKPFNIDAENIYFPNGFERTEAWGYFGATANGVLQNETKPSEGEAPKNLVQVFEHYLVKPVFPTNVKVAANVPTATFTASYVNSSPVSISAIHEDKTLGTNKYVLANSKIVLNASFNAEIQINQHVTELIYGPITVTGMTYGGRYKSEDNGAFTIFTNNSLSGDSVTLTSVADSSVTRGERKLSLYDTSNTLLSGGTKTHDSSNTSDQLTVSNVSYQVVCGTNTITANGSTKSTFGRTIKKGSDKYQSDTVTIPKLPYTDIEYYNNKKSETKDVPDDNTFDPKKNRVVDINAEKTAGVSDSPATFTVTGYYPIWYGLISGSKVTGLGTIATLESYKKTGADGYIGSQKIINITPTTNQASSSHTPFIIVPSNRTVTFGMFTGSGSYSSGPSGYTTYSLSDWTTDGNGQNITYTAYILNGAQVSWAGNGQKNFKLTIK